MIKHGQCNGLHTKKELKRFCTSHDALILTKETDGTIIPNRRQRLYIILPVRTYASAVRHTHNDGKKMKKHGQKKIK